MPLSRDSRGEWNETSSPSTKRVPSRGTHRAAEDLQERRLAGAVVADEPDDLAAPDLDVDVLQRREAAVEVRDPSRREDGIGRSGGLGRYRRHRSALRASWSVSTARISSTPITMYCV